MKKTLKFALAASAVALAAQASAQVTFYEHEGYRGRTFSTSRQIGNFERQGFNDRASSVVVERGRWEVCEHQRFEGRCVVLRRGNYPSLRDMGLENRVSSVRPADKRRRYDHAPEPVAQPAYEYRRRPNERIFQAPITSVRAVMGPPEQRCWVERQDVGDAGRGDRNLGGAIAGAVIGGILGHQVGGGTGRDVATVGGAVAGAAIGSNVGRDNGMQQRDVRRCDSVPNNTPAYWDVAYRYRGTEHHAQMSAPPQGGTIEVNQNGEPRQ